MGTRFQPRASGTPGVLKGRLMRDQDLPDDAAAGHSGPPIHRTTSLVVRCSRLVIGACAMTLVAQTLWLSLPPQDPSPRTFADFDAFYLAAHMVWRGEIHQAYHFLMFTRAQEAFFGAPRFLPWAYPPQFNLLVAPFAFLPYGAAYGLFTSTTMAAYLLTLKRLSGNGFAVIVLATSPAILVTILCGQNGFLTGALIGLTCVGLQGRHTLAGLPLGLMIIKPHLAVAHAAFMLMTRRWAAVIVGAVTVAATIIMTTMLLGMNIWAAFVAGADEARSFLKVGTYPLFRMVSVYSALLSFGFSATTALMGQVMVAILVLAIVCLAALCGLPVRQSLGLTAIGSLLISPYAYDYDLPILGIGLSLLLPDLLRRGSRREQVVILALSFVTCVIGLAQTFLRLKAPVEAIAKAGDNMALSFAGLTLLIVLGLICRILERSRKEDLEGHHTGHGSLGGPSNALIRATRAPR
jgi:hypothetical protein